MPDSCMKSMSMSAARLPFNYPVRQRHEQNRYLAALDKVSLYHDKVEAFYLSYAVITAPRNKLRVSSGRRHAW